ncbi:hypothetical protein MMC07_003337 [Pseudocyphellaria aurata]|nr:hypothetical protein [Pseudocyphellaria aurata]
MASQASRQAQDLRQDQDQNLEHMPKQIPEQMQTHGQGQARGKAEEPRDPVRSLDQAIVFLKAVDDTSRFVGLALLKSILDNHASLLGNTEVIKRCWAAIPAKFIDRLLRAPKNKERSEEESVSMVELAVAVLHAFIVLFPTDVSDDGKSLGRIEGLIDILAWSPPHTRTQILEIFLTVASTPTGSTAVLCAKRWAHLVDIVPRTSEEVQHTHLAMDVIKFAIVNTPSQTPQMPNVQQIVNETLSSLISSCKENQCRLLFQMLHDIFSRLPLSVISPSPLWLNPLAILIRQHCLNRPIESTVLLAASLLHIFPTEFPNLLFNGSLMPIVTQDSKPGSYAFMKLLIAEIQDAIPIVRVGINSQNSSKLDVVAACYDIISAFIGFLIHFIGEEYPPLGVNRDINHPPQFPFTPSLLLQLRLDISDVMSLTIENFRTHLENILYDNDRLVIAPSLSQTTSSTTIQQNTVALSQIRALALWLREDDNEALRKKAASIAKILLDLYGAGIDQMLQFRSPILIAWEGIINVPEGVEAFLAADGWRVLSTDLQAILASSSDSEDKGASFARGIDIVRVLLNVVESDVVGPSKVEWMSVVELATTSYAFPSSSAAVGQPASPINRADLFIATAQLAVELIARAPRNVRRRSMSAARKLFQQVNNVLSQAGQDDGDDNVRVWEISRDVRDGAKEVVMALRELGVGCEEETV